MKSPHVAFRRTFVGLKRAVDVIAIRLPTRFQTNLCGVEAFAESGLFDSAGNFQTNLCGVEAPTPNRRRSIRRFQTNLCGVEAARYSPPSSTPAAFQTNLCGVEANYS